MDLEQTYFLGIWGETALGHNFERMICKLHLEAVPICYPYIFAEYAHLDCLEDYCHVLLWYTGSSCMRDMCFFPYFL